MFPAVLTYRLAHCFFFFFFFFFWTWECLSYSLVWYSGCFFFLLCRLSCDKEIVRWMRGRSLGNSSTSAYRNLCVRHREHWIAQTTHYLSVVGKFPDYATDPSRLTTQLPQMVSVPFPAWLLSVYANDVLTRLPEQKAGVTSIFGTILRMDSTKKVRRHMLVTSLFVEIRVGYVWLIWIHLRRASSFQSVFKHFPEVAFTNWNVGKCLKHNTSHA